MRTVNQLQQDYNRTILLSSSLPHCLSLSLARCQWGTILSPTCESGTMLEGLLIRILVDAPFDIRLPFIALTLLRLLSSKKSILVSGENY